MENFMDILAEELPVLRVKSSKLLKPVVLKFNQNNVLNYKKKKVKILDCLLNKSNIGYKKFTCKKIFNFLVNLSDLLEIRHGYNSDGLHRASKHYKFQEKAPVSVFIF